MRDGKRGEGIDLIAVCEAAEHIWSREAFDRFMSVAAIEDKELEREFRRLWNNYAYLILDLPIEESAI